MTAAEDIFKLAREKTVWGLSPNEVQAVFDLDQSTYDEVVTLLMADTGDYARSQPNYHYRDVYNCQVGASCLFAMRPNKDLYDVVLQGSLKIADPSSNRDAVAALLQVKSAGEIALDFLKLINTNRGNPNTDEMIDRIFWMFYWLGTSPGRLQINRAWPGYSITTLYRQRYGKGDPWPGEYDPETGYPFTPPTDAAEALRISLLILETMLDLFEANSSNQTVRSIIAQLPLPDKDYLLPYRDRIVRVFVSASQSADEYVRQRVSDPKSRQLIDEYNA